jgi:hypothetical protein
VHQPHARNGGLIGLAAAAIALGPVDIMEHLADIEDRLTIPPGSCQLPRRNRPSRPRLLLRPRCPRPLLRLREHV